MSARAAFGGAKAALICEHRLVVLRRDDISTIPFPGLLDLPGGGREGLETPEACAARETYEETGIRIEPARFRGARPYAGPALPNWFMWCAITEAEGAGVRLGDEGQAVWMMEIAAFLGAQDAVPHLQDRLRSALEM